MYHCWLHRILPPSPQSGDIVQQGENLKKEYNEALEKELKHVEELVKTSVNNGIKKLEDEIAEQQRTLASLGFFAFSQKKACKTKIQELTSEISYRKTLDYFKKQFWPYQNKADTAKTRYADTVAGYIRQAFTDKEYPNHEHMAQLKNMKSLEDMYWGRKAGDKLVAEEILDYLYGNENGRSEMDLIDKCFDYVGSLSMLLSKLVSARQIVREYVDGTCRYYHHGLKRFNKITLPTLKPGFSLPWPTPKDPKEVLKWSEE